jgi:CcmD family protein
MGHYFTLAVTLVIWAGIFFYLLRVERKVRELERDEER